jgi:hypothetical protein
LANGLDSHRRLLLDALTAPCITMHEVYGVTATRA